MKRYGINLTGGKQMIVVAPSAAAVLQEWPRVFAGYEWSAAHVYRACDECELPEIIGHSGDHVDVNGLKK